MRCGNYILLSQAAPRTLTVFASVASLVFASCSPQGHEACSQPRMPVEGSVVNKDGLVDGLEFNTVVERVFPAPEPGHEARIPMVLRITNRQSVPVLINQLDTIRIQMVDARGREYPMDGGRDGTRPGQVLSKPLQPGSTLEIDRSARLVHANVAGDFSLRGEDGFGGTWNIDGLRRETYQLQIYYESHLERVISGVAVWKGNAVTRPVEVEIK